MCFFVAEGEGFASLCFARQHFALGQNARLASKENSNAHWAFSPYGFECFSTTHIKGTDLQPVPFMWRRERDSNPRDSCLPTHFPGVPVQPLLHPSTIDYYSNYCLVKRRCRGGRSLGTTSPASFRIMARIVSLLLRRGLSFSGGRPKCLHVSRKSSST